MSPVSRLKFHLIGLQILIWQQRSLRLVLRAVWLGIGGGLLFWGCNQLLGWFPDPLLWLLAGVVLAGIPLILIPFSYPRRKTLFWMIDRRFTVKEQISTAWQELMSSRRGPLQDDLFADTQAIVNRLRWRIYLLGWAFGRDLLSLLIVCGLAYAVYQTFFVATTAEELIQGSQLLLLPPLGVDATAEEIFPEGLSALAPISSENAYNSPMSESDAPLEGLFLTENDKAALNQMLQNLGKSLNQQAATYQISQDLQSQNLNRASSAMETLADQVDELDDQTQEQLAQAIQEAADSLEGTNLQTLQDDLQQTAESLAQQLAEESGTMPSLEQIQVKENIDRVASDLRTIEEQMQLSQASSSTEDGIAQQGGAGNAVGSRERGNPEDFNRLRGEGETLEFEALSEAAAGFLVSGEAEHPSSDISQGNSASSTNVDDQIVESYIIPFYYPWKWRHVVSAYFQKR